MRRRDAIYYVGWFALLILFGMWMLLWALGAVGAGEGLLLWMMSGGILIMVIGMISGSARGSNFQLAAGMVITVFALILLGISSNILGGFVGTAVGIILIGIIGLVLLYRNIRLEA